MPKPEMKSVASSNIQAIGYDPTTKALHVKFGSGHYVHENVPVELHDQLLAADSAGKFYHANIKGKFKTTKVNQ